ncbi:hypothetical protein [Bacteroides cellulosilyticus]|uniref:hypothetical protein n=1 Tax=Bacteroides cellulosilyticus TaxID=246787 RepID=UPI0032EABAD2
MAVVSPLVHVGGDDLVGYNQRTSRLGHFAHLAVEVFYDPCSVLAEHQPADAVSTSFAVLASGWQAESSAFQVLIFIKPPII